jgi:hypothetical protein
MKYVIFLSLVLVCLVGCASPRYVHAVYLTCKPDTPDAQIESLVAESRATLSRISSIQRIEVGRRDHGANRAVNVTDFDVATIMYFNDRAGVDEYIQNPLHRRLLEKYQPILQTIRVYDFIESGTSSTR